MKNRLARLWRSLLTIRFVFTLLLTGMIALFGWYAVGEFLRFIAGDATLRVLFIGAETVWVAYLYRTVFVVVGCIFGFALGGAIFRRIEQGGERLRALDSRTKFALIAGMGVGLFLGAALSLPIILAVPSRVIGVVLALLLTIAASYLTTVAALSMKQEIHFYNPPVEDEKPPVERYKILDTNVIIDGRVTDVAKAGFIEGPLYVPGFVLEELQHIADSSDDLKRGRGRRGLDVLNEIQKERELVVGTYDRFAPPGEPVDARLVRLAKSLNGSLVTNDWNLNRVAELQGVPVLNLNELANAVKPIVLPGEEMRVQIVREGKEALQGVAYLDDGTMVVIAGGRGHVGETVDVRVTSLRQTQQGKMIFARLISDDDNTEHGHDDDESGNGPAGHGPGPNGNGPSGYSDRGGPRYTGDSRPADRPSPGGDGRFDSRSGQRRPVRRDP